MARNKATRHGCRHDAPRSVPCQVGNNHYTKGTRYAAWLFVAMFAVLSFGAVFLGW